MLRKILNVLSGPLPNTTFVDARLTLEPVRGQRLLSAIVRHVAAVLSKDASSILIAIGKFEVDEVFSYPVKIIHFQGLTADLASQAKSALFNSSPAELPLRGQKIRHEVDTNSLLHPETFPARCEKIPCSDTREFGVKTRGTLRPLPPPKADQTAR